MGAGAPLSHTNNFKPIYILNLNDLTVLYTIFDKKGLQHSGNTR